MVSFYSRVRFQLSFDSGVGFCKVCFFSEVQFVSTSEYGFVKFVSTTDQGSAQFLSIPEQCYVQFVSTPEYCSVQVVSTLEQGYVQFVSTPEKGSVQFVSFIIGVGFMVQLIQKQGLNELGCVCSIQFYIVGFQRIDSPGLGSLLFTPGADQTSGNRLRIPAIYK